MDDAGITADALAAAAGDQRALTRFVRRTQGDVHRLCAYLGPADDAADLAQETYLRAIRSLAGFRGDAPARLWLLSIARRTCADHFRTRYRRRAIEARVDPPPAASDPTDPALWDLLEHLHPDQRAAFALTQVLGLSYAEAAVACDCPVGTIRSRVARARAVLVELLLAADRAEVPTATVEPGTSVVPPATG